MHRIIIWWPPACGVGPAGDDPARAVTMDPRWFLSQRRPNLVTGGGRGSRDLHLMNHGQRVKALMAHIFDNLAEEWRLAEFAIGHLV